MNPVSHSIGQRNAARISAQLISQVVCAVSTEEQRLFLSHAAKLFDGLPAAVTWVSTDHPAAALDQLREINPEVLVTGWSTPALPGDWISSSRCALHYLCHVTGSVRWLAPRSFLERGGLVTNWGGLPSVAVAEHALLLALAALRNLRGWEGIIRRTEHADNHIARLRTRTLFGRTVGIHGFGQVARALVGLLKPFGVTIRAYSHGVPADLMMAAGVAPDESLETLAVGSEVFFECEALTSATAGRVTASVLAALPAGCVFVNVARGRLIDEAALLHEAMSGRIRVALDVVTAEPLTADSAFCGLADAVLSPHIAAPTFDQYPDCGKHAALNVARYLAGEPLVGQLTLDEYDRST